MLGLQEFLKSYYSQSFRVGLLSMVVGHNGRELLQFSQKYSGI